MLSLNDSFQNKVSANQYHVTIFRAQIKSSLTSRVFLKLTADQVLGFRLDCGLKPGYYSGGEVVSTSKGKISVQI